MFMVPNLSTEAMVEAMTALTSTEGRIDILITDPGSQLTPLANEVSPVTGHSDEENLVTLNKLRARAGKNVWLNLLTHRYSDKERKMGIRFKVSVKGQSHIQGLAEKVVERIKLYFSDEKVFKAFGEGTLTEYECRQRLYLVMHNINSVPLHNISPGVRFSPNDLLGASGRIAVNINFPDMFQENLVNPTVNVKDALKHMERINTRIRLDIFRFFLPLMRDDSVRLGKDRGRKGTGDPTVVDDLTEGSIVVDLDKVRKTHSLQGSIARVELLTPGNRGALISSVRQAALKKVSEEIRKEIRSCKEHKEIGCQVCLPELLKEKPKAVLLDVRARPSDRLYMIHREPTTQEVKQMNRRKSPRFVIPKAGRVDEPILEGQYTFPLSDEYIDEYLDTQKKADDIEEGKRLLRSARKDKDSQIAKESRRIIRELRELRPANKIKALAGVLDTDGREQKVTDVGPEVLEKVDEHRRITRSAGKKALASGSQGGRVQTLTQKTLGVNILNIPSRKT